MSKQLSVEEAKEKGLTSMDIAEEKRKQLEQIFPEVFTEDKVDFDQLRRVLGDFVDADKERFGLNWPGKAECMKVIQQPSVATLKPARDESVDFDATENLFIEGDNLEVLKLLQKAYFGKVKMIYIDPPYNTGKEFIYPDKYAENLDTYLEYTGQKDAEGRKFATNTDTVGRYHSNWLNMMYPRLYLAKNLLREDGVIFISINDVEHANLKKLCDDIFGAENMVANLIWSNKEGGGSSDSSYFRIKHEYILCYARNIENVEICGVPINNEDRYTQTDEYVEERGPYYLQKLGMGSIQYSESLDYEIQTPDGGFVAPKDNNRGKKACWRWSKTKLEWGTKNGFIEIKKDSSGVWTVYTKQYLKCDNEGNIIERTQRPFGVIDDFSSTQASKYLDNLGLGAFFDYTKPSALIAYLIKRSVNSEDIVLDFFAGSATTGQSVMEVNVSEDLPIKHILVQLPEKIEDDSEAFKAGFINIADLAKERIRRAAKKIAEENPDYKGDMGFKVFKLAQSNFNIWEGNTEEIDDLTKQLEMAVDHIKDASTPEDILYELLLKAGFPLTTKVEKVIMAEKEVFSVEDGAMLICLEKKLTQDVLDAMADAEPFRVVCLDEGFRGNDELKANAVQTFRSRARDKESAITFTTV